MRAESLRIAGQKVAAPDGRVIEVRNPFTRELVGTVPKASLAQVRETFEIAHACRPKLSRAERAGILNRAAALVRERAAAYAALIGARPHAQKVDADKKADAARMAAAAAAAKSA